jgi:hypothetical protein
MAQTPQGVWGLKDVNSYRLKMLGMHDSFFSTNSPFARKMTPRTAPSCSRIFNGSSPELPSTQLAGYMNMGASSSQSNFMDTR